MNSKQENGVSPVIAVILMLGLAVSIAAVASLTVFDLQQDVGENGDVTFTVDKQDGTATVVKAGNVDKLRLAGNENENIDASVGNTLQLQNSGGNPNIIATVNGEDQLVREIEAGSISSVGIRDEVTVS